MSIVYDRWGRNKLIKDTERFANNPRQKVGPREKITDEGKGPVQPVKQFCIRCFIQIDLGTRICSPCLEKEPLRLCAICFDPFRHYSAKRTWCNKCYKEKVEKGEMKGGSRGKVSWRRKADRYRKR